MTTILANPYRGVRVSSSPRFECNWLTMNWKSKSTLHSIKHLTPGFGEESGIVIGMVGKITIHAPECRGIIALTLFQSCQRIAAHRESI